MPAQNHQTMQPASFQPTIKGGGYTAVSAPPLSTPFLRTTVTTVGECLLHLGVGLLDLAACPVSVEAEFQIVKRAFLALALREHPDRWGRLSGGTDRDRSRSRHRHIRAVADFRRTCACFEAVRVLVVGGRVRFSLLTHWHDPAPEYTVWWEHLSRGTPTVVPSYEYYCVASAQTAENPKWTVQVATSGRSHCIRCKAAPRHSSPSVLEADGRGSGSPVAVVDGLPDSPVDGPHYPTKKKPKCHHPSPANPRRRHASLEPHAIRQGSVRVGRWEADRAGSFGGWVHLACWAVPPAVWAGLTDPNSSSGVALDLQSMEGFSLNGFTALPAAWQRRVVDHVRHSGHWKTVHLPRPLEFHPPPLSSQEGSSPTATSYAAVGTESP